jgi:broad specificity phosphatase PhoE
VILFVRHGQTLVNREGRLQGRLDAPLTDLGLEQARLAAGGLAGCGASLVLTSPLQRAAHTAAEIGRALGVAVEVDDRLVELDYGDWDGRKLGEVSAAEWERWRGDPSFAPPGGESLEAVGRRVGEFCATWSGPDRTVVAVSHVSPIKAAVVWALGVADATSWRMHLDVASITRIGSREGGPPFLAGYNDTSHLRAREDGLAG